MAGSDHDLFRVSARASPCVDFATYACGRFGWGYDVRRRLGRAQGFDAVPSLTTFFVQLDAGKYDQSNYGVKVLRDFHRRCLHPQLRDAGLAVIARLLAEITNARTLEDLARTLGEQRTYGFQPLIGLRPVLDDRSDPEINRAGVWLRGPPLPWQFYARNDYLVSEHEAHWRRLANLAQSPPAVEVAAALRVARWLARSRELFGGAREEDAEEDEAEGGLPQPVSWNALRSSRFPWSAYLRGVGLTEAVAFLPLGRKTLVRVDELASLPVDDLKSYVRMMVVEQYAEYLSDSLAREEYRFHSAIVGELFDDHYSLEGLCQGLALRDLEQIAADAFLSVMADAASESVARRLFGLLRYQFIARVRRQGWMDEPTRRSAVEKLQSVTLHFIENVDSRDFDSYELAPGSFFEATRSLGAWRAGIDLHGVGRAPKERSLSPSLAPASYTPAVNSIWLSPILVRPPFLQPEEFNATSFGTFGVTASHELSHAIGQTWRGFDATGKRRRTWSPRVSDVFNLRAACLRSQFAHIGGRADMEGSAQALEEDTADLTGVQIALDALVFEAERTNRTPASERRDFFVGFAQQMCLLEGSGPRTALAVVRDPHAVVKARINATLANVPEFAETFSCTPGMPMAPRHRCSVW